MDERIERINELLIAIMAQCIKRECIAMANDGASIDDMNVVLKEHILPHYRVWHWQMLARVTNWVCCDDGVSSP